MAMLRILATLRDDNANRGGQGKIAYDFTALHLDEAGVAKPADDEACNAHSAAVAKLVAAECGRLKVPLQVLPLASLVCDGAAAAIHGRACLSDREDVYDVAKRAAVLNAACALGCVGAVFGHCAETVAWRSLSELVRGRGASLGSSYGHHGIVAVGPAKEMTTFRPMRGILAKEAVLFCRAQAVRWDYAYAPSTMTSLPSINRTLEAFMNHLAVAYRSTVFNVVTTVAQIAPTNRGASNPASEAAPAAAATAPPAAGQRPARVLRQHAHQQVNAQLRRGYDRGAPRCVLCGGTVEEDGESILLRDVVAASATSEAQRTCYGCAVLGAHLGVAPGQLVA
jgi:hypothetical protein